MGRGEPMIAAFCLRVALGVVALMPLLPPRLLHPRFYRTQFLIALGLTAVAGIAAYGEATTSRLVAIGLAAVCTMIGSVVWGLEPPPFGHAILGFSAAFLAVTVLQPFGRFGHDAHPALIGLDALTSAALLGSALTAMLVGHSYLISPGMTLSPLYRALALLFASILIRAAVAASAYIVWSQADAGRTLTEDATYWLPLRWLVGILAPAGFGLLAWLTARIRSTQSATGILNVVVICVFLGELLGVLVHRATGYPM